MLIANPVYDIAFRYFMQDEKIAKGFISRIIGQEIVEIQFAPTEYVVFVDLFEGKAMRMDFQAVIKDKNGEKQKVLIELQKSKNALDIQRFRDYLSHEYKKPNGIRIKKIKGKNIEIPEYYPIITIYLLGYSYNRNFPAAVEVERIYRDANTKEVLKVKKDKFIERLTHNSYVIQLTKIDKNVRTPLERILTLFDQKKQTKKQRELLDYPEDEADKYSDDELLQKALRRLNAVVLEEKLRKELEFEEELEQRFSNVFEELKQKKEEVEENKKVLEENKKVLEEKDKVLEEKDRIIEELQKRLSA